MSKDDREQYFSVKEERKFEKTIRDDPPFKKALLEDETDAWKILHNEAIQITTKAVITNSQAIKELPWNHLQTNICIINSRMPKENKQ